ncbi:1 Acyl sn Glycerol 3 P acylTase Acyltransferase 3 [Nucleospora cyclopteri]
MVFRILAFFNSQRAKNILKTICFHLLVAYCSLFFTRSFYLSYNPKVLQKIKSIGISNHCCDYDWLFVLIIFFHLGKYTELFILLKEGLTKLPFLGFTLTQHGHVSISRNNREKDIKQIKSTAKKCKALNIPWTLFIFPEGTYPNVLALKSAQRYAKRERIELLQNLLFPRKVGFNYLTELTDYDGLIDMTILNNPYHFLLAEEQTHLKYLLTEKIKISPIFIMNWHEKNEIAPEFLDDIFRKKDKLIENYKEAIGNGFCDNFDKVKNVLNLIQPESKNKLIELNVATRFTSLLLIFSPGGIFLLVLLKKWMF